MTWNPKLGIGLEVPPKKSAAQESETNNAKQSVHIPDLTIPLPPGTHSTIPVDPPGGFPHMGHGPVVPHTSRGPESFCPRCVEDGDSRKSIDDENAEAHGFQTPK